MKKTLLSVMLVLGCVLSACTEASRPVSITPVPLSCQQGEGSFRWKSPTTVLLTDADIDATVIKTAFAGSGLPVELRQSADEDGHVVRLERVERLESGKALVVFEYPGKSVYAEFNGCTVEDIEENRLSIKIMQEK